MNTERSENIKNRSIEIKKKCIATFINEEKKELDQINVILDNYKNALIKNLNNNPSNERIEKKLKKIESIINDFKEELNREINYLDISNNQSLSTLSVENNNALTGMILGGMLGYFAGASYDMNNI